MIYLNEWKGEMELGTEFGEMRSGLNDLGERERERC